MKILNCYTGCPWYVHDARVLRNSGRYHKVEAGELIIPNFYILSDSAHPLRNWLITPFKNVGQLTRQQIKFNQRLSNVRQNEEEHLGFLKTDLDDCVMFLCTVKEKSVL